MLNSLPALRHFRPFALLSGLSVIALPLLGCDEDPEPAFDEVGDPQQIWSLSSFALDGAEAERIADTQKDLFFLKYDRSIGVVAAASCGTGGNFGIKSSTCGISGDSVWECRCFSYEFDEELQYWVEFPEGQAAPGVVDREMAQSMDATKVDGTAQIRLRPLPPEPGPLSGDGLFESNGETSWYVLDPKAISNANWLESNCNTRCGLTN